MMTTDDAAEPVRLVGASSSAALDRQAQTLTFEHHGSVATDEQKALSPLIIPLGTIASVECKRGSSTNWFWVVRRGVKPWRDGVWTDPCGVVSTDDPLSFVEEVRAAVSLAAPEVPEVEAPVQKRGWAGRIAGGFGRAVVDGFFDTR